MTKRAFLAAAMLLASGAYALSPSSVSCLPSAGAGQGRCIEGVCSQWVTSVWILNPAAQDVQVLIAFLERDKPNGEPVTHTVTVPAGQTVAFPDVMANPLGLHDVFGAVCFVAETPVVASGRVFDSNVQTNKGKGSAGQLFAATPLLASIGTGESTEVFGLAQDAGGDWRSNVGFVEVTGKAVTVLAQRLAGDGTVLAEKSYPVLGHEAKQFNIDDIGAGAGLNQRVRFSITSGDGRIIAFGSRLDNATGDPSTAEMTTRSLDPALLAGQWTGLWSNTTFGSTGGATMTMTWDPSDQTLQATMDVNGMVFGGVDPPPQTASAALAGQGFTFSQSSPVFGQIAVTVGTDGKISGSLGAVPAATISSVDVSGAVMGGVMALKYTVNFAPSGTAVGVLYLEHQ